MVVYTNDQCSLWALVFCFCFNSVIMYDQELGDLYVYIIARNYILGAKSVRSSNDVGAAYDRPYMEEPIII